MSYKVVVTNSASMDLNSIVDYIYYSLKNPTAAVHLVNMFEGVVLSLAEFPKRHAVHDDPVLQSNEIRIATFGNYFALYTVDDNSKEVCIVRILYKRRDWISILSLGK